MIDSFLKYIRYEKRYSRHTITSYHTDLLQFKKFVSFSFQDQPVEEVDYKTIRAWMVSLVEGNHTTGSINRKIASLRSFYKFLLREGVISKNPTLKIRLLKPGKKLPDFINETDIMQMLNNHDYGSDFEGIRDKLILELLYGTGIRLNELINLKQSDINFYEQTLKVLGKRNKERIIPLNTELVNLTQMYIAVKNKDIGINENGYLLVTNKGDKAYPMMIYRIVRKYLDIFTSIDKRSPHIIRHTFATHLLNKGADLNAVKDLLGHTSLAATQIYTHNSLEKLKKVFDQAHPKA